MNSDEQKNKGDRPLPDPDVGDDCYYDYDADKEVLITPQYQTVVPPHYPVSTPQYAVEAEPHYPVLLPLPPPPTKMKRVLPPVPLFSEDTSPPAKKTKKKKIEQACLIVRAVYIGETTGRAIPTGPKFVLVGDVDEIEKLDYGGYCDDASVAFDETYHFIKFMRRVQANAAIKIIRNVASINVEDHCFD